MVRLSANTIWERTENETEEVLNVALWYDAQVSFKQWRSQVFFGARRDTIAAPDRNCELYKKSYLLIGFPFIWLNNLQLVKCRRQFILPPILLPILLHGALAPSPRMSLGTRGEQQICLRVVRVINRQFITFVDIGHPWVHHTVILDGTRVRPSVWGAVFEGKGYFSSWCHLSVRQISV